ncbi:MAG: hypothetical protein JXA37_06900 [Chloroflexia bacterium]|nr:hypothetical protein [Chloroflexia bacterium]
MKRAIYSGLLLLVLLLAACGPTGPTVELPAAEMNLSLADLEEDFKLQQELSYAEVLDQLDLNPEDAGKASDAHMRIFETDERQLITFIIVFDAASTAKSSLNDAQDGFQEALKQNEPSLAFTRIEGPEIGEELIFVGAELREQDSRVYLLGFRKYNVTGLLVASGASESVDEIWLSSLAQVMANGIPEPVEE